MAWPVSIGWSVGCGAGAWLVAEGVDGDAAGAAAVEGAGAILDGSGEHRVAASTAKAKKIRAKEISPQDISGIMWNPSSF